MTAGAIDSVGQKARLTGTGRPAVLGFYAAVTLLAALANDYLLGTQDERLGLVLGAVAVGGAAGAGVLALLRGPLAGVPQPLLRLGPLWLIYNGWSFGLSSLTWLQPQSGSQAVIRPESVSAALSVMTAGVVLLTAGYTLAAWLPSSPWWQRIESRVRGGARGRTLRSSGAPLLVAALGLLAITVRLRNGRFGYLADPRAALLDPSSLDQLLGLLTGAGQLGLVLVTLWASGAWESRRSPRKTAVLVALVVALATLALFGGGKQDVLLVALLLGLGRLLAGRRLRVRSVVLGLIGLLLLFPINQDYRGYLRGSDARPGADQAARQLPGILVNTLRGSAPTDLLGRSVASISRRTRQIDNLAIVLQRTPEEIPYERPLDLASKTILGVVPRAVWPEKPIISTGYEFSQRYYGISASIFTATAITPAGDLYRHGGLATLLVGMFTLGWFIQRVDAHLHPSDQLEHVLVYVAVAIPILKFELDAVALFLTIFQSSVTALLLSRWAFRRVV